MEQQWAIHRFLRFDESRVREFSMNVTGNDLYPTQHAFKYPKAGEDNAKVSLHMYDLNSKKTAKMTLDKYEYIPRIKWSSHVNTLIVTTFKPTTERLKTYLKLNASNSNATLLLNEKDEAYVDIHDNLFKRSQLYMDKRKKTVLIMSITTILTGN